MDVIDPTIKRPYSDGAGEMNRVSTSVLRRWVMIAGLALIALIIAGHSYEAWQDYRAAITESERSQLALSRVLSEQTARMIQEVDVVLSDYALWVASSDGRMAAEQVKRERLRATVLQLPFVYSAFLVNDTGHLLASTQSDQAENLNLVNREIFTAPKNSLRDVLHIGSPFISRRDGARTFALSRRINGDGDQFAGVVIARLAFEYLTGFYAGATATPDTSIHLLRDDGVVLARFPILEEPIANDNSIRRLYADGTVREHIRYSMTAGINEIEALRKVDGYPVVVVVKRPLASVIEAWKHHEFASAMRTLTLTILAGILLITLRAALTRHDQMERERRQLEQELENTQRLEALGILAASVAHDFNNVLTAIVGYGELVRKSQSEFSESANIDKLLAAADRARILVRRVLTFNPRRALHHTAITIQPIVAEVMQQIEATLPPAVTMKVSELDASASILGDAMEVHQVVMNLCSNAIHAMPSGGQLEIGLEVKEVQEHQTLTLGAITPGSWVCLSVIDNGVGLTAEQIESIFEPFYTTRQAGQGTGIGLTVVQNIISRTHGALDVQSQVGFGTCICVYWPSVATARTTLMSASDSPRIGNGETIMIVDDESDLVMLAEEVLASIGYEPVGFTGAKAALDAFRRTPERFDAIVTDERMGSLRGCDLARLIHKIDPSVPIILMTAYRDTDIDQRAQQAGIAEILDKPLRADTLNAALARHIVRERI